MTTTFAMDVIKTFQQKEAEAFRNFLASPYFTKGANVIALNLLFEALYEAALENNLDNLEKADLHLRIFPAKEVVEGKIDKLMSELKRFLEQFLIANRYLSSENEGNQLIDLAAEIRRLGVESRYQQIADKAERYTASLTKESLQILSIKYLKALEDYEWSCTNYKIKGDLNIPETIGLLDTYYYARKTWMLNHLMLLQKIIPLPEVLENLEVDKWSVSENILKHSIFLELSLDVHNLLKKQSPEIKDFHYLLKKIQLNEEYLSQESLSEFNTYLRNLCVILINKGDIHLNYSLHEINKDNLRRGYFYQNGKINSNSYLNITLLAIFVKESAWATAFVEQHKNIVTGENEDQDFYRMNKAICLFGEKKYDEALQIIPFGSKHSYYYLIARVLEVKIYYEMRLELLDYKIDAFKMFISRAGRKVLGPNYHELYSNFANFVLQLSQSEGGNAKKRSEILTKRISEKKVVGERGWLLEKAKELGERAR